MLSQAIWIFFFIGVKNDKLLVNIIITITYLSRKTFIVSYVPSEDRITLVCSTILILYCKGAFKQVFASVIYSIKTVHKEQSWSVFNSFTTTSYHQRSRKVPRKYTFDHYQVDKGYQYLCRCNTTLEVNLLPYNCLIGLS